MIIYKFQFSHHSTVYNIPYLFICFIFVILSPSISIQQLYIYRTDLEIILYTYVYYISTIPRYTVQYI